MRFQQILAPVDLSDTSKAGLRLALSMAGDQGGKLTALYVDTDSAAVSSALTEHGRNVDAGHAAERYLGAVRRAVSSWVRASIGAREDVEIVAIDDAHADEAILRYAVEGGYDLICMGAYGTRGWQRYVMGSTASAVVRRTPLPVLTVRSREDADEPADVLYRDFRNVLAGVDLGPGSIDVVRAAAKIAGKDTTITLAHVVPVPVSHGLYGTPLTVPGEDLNAAREWSENALQRLANQAELDDLPTRILCDFPSHGLLRVEEEMRPDVTVVGTHGRTGFQRLTLGSVAERVAQQATGPVLIVPTPDSVE